jgi:hypothetical protein
VTTFGVRIPLTVEPGTPELSVRAAGAVIESRPVVTANVMAVSGSLPDEAAASGAVVSVLVGVVPGVAVVPAVVVVAGVAVVSAVVVAAGVAVVPAVVVVPGVAAGPVVAKLAVAADAAAGISIAATAVPALTASISDLRIVFPQVARLSAGTSG